MKSVTLIIALVLAVSRARAGTAQTFVQVTQVGSNIDPRLTRTLTQGLISRRLLHPIGTFVTYIEGGIVAGRKMGLLLRVVR